MKLWERSSYRRASLKFEKLGNSPILCYSDSVIPMPKSQMSDTSVVLDLAFFPPQAFVDFWSEMEGWVLVSMPRWRVSDMGTWDSWKVQLTQTHAIWNWMGRGKRQLRFDTHSYLYIPVQTLLLQLYYLVTVISKVVFTHWHGPTILLLLHSSLPMRLLGR